MEAAASASEKQGNKKKQPGINWREVGVETARLVGIATLQAVVGVLATRSVNMVLQKRSSDNVLPMKRAL